MSVPFLSSITYQVIVDILLVATLYCTVLMLSSSHSMTRGFGMLFLGPLMLAACTFNAMMIIGRAEMPKTTMEQALAQYREADKNLAEKELELNRLVEAQMKPLIKARDLKGLNELVDMMPRRYKGSRHIYEAMIQIEDKK